MLLTGLPLYRPLVGWQPTLTAKDPAVVLPLESIQNRSLSRLTQFNRLGRVTRRYGNPARDPNAREGAGAVATEAATAAGTGTVSYTGTGTPSTATATMAGTGEIVNPPFRPFTQFNRLHRSMRQYGDSSRTVSGSATGSGAISNLAATAAGTGAYSFTGFVATGTPSTQATTVAGTGTYNAAPTVSITTPVAAATVYNNVVATGTASAAGAATITLIEWSTDGSTWATTGVTGTTSWSATLTTQTSGSKTIYIRATDSFGGRNTATVTVTVFAFGTTVAAENALTGVSLTSNLFSGFGTETTQGFARGFSFAPGDTVDICGIVGGTQVSFTVYRLGYYGANLARSIITFTGTPNASQPAPVNDTNTRSQNCNAWTSIGQWRVPDDALSGMYMIKMYRTDATTQGCNILLCVRATANRDVGYMVAEFTWHLAYNMWGTSNTRASGRSFYGTNDAFDIDNGRGARGYYDRPTTIRNNPAGQLTRFWRCEMATIAFLERNGYDVGYAACKDVSGASGATILGYFGTLVISGHNEYWSQEMYDRIQTRINAGMDLFNLSGNTCFWRVIYNATDRYIECWKETENDGVKIGVSGQVWGTQPTDSSPPALWTGTWRDNAALGKNQPENALLGNIFIQNNDGNRNLTLDRARFTGHRAWANTTVATTGTGTLTFTSLHGFEIDTYKMPSGQGIDSDLVTSINNARPASLILLSYQSVTSAGQLLLDDGDGYGSGTYDYGIVLRKTSGGGMVFGTGSMNTSWGLYNFSDGDVGDVTSTEFKQFAVNILAEMGVQPATLEGTLVAASASGDTTGPTVVITSHTNNQYLGLNNTSITLAGTASTTGGVVANIEYSRDGGTTWTPTDDTTPTAWSIPMTLTNNAANTILVRGVDDWANPGATNTIVLYTQDQPTNITGTGTPSTQTTTVAGTGSNVSFIGTGTPAAQVTTPAGTGSNVSFIGTGAVSSQTATIAGTGSVVHNLGTGAPAAEVATTAGSGSVVSFIGTATITSDAATVAGSGSNVSFIGAGTPTTQVATTVGSGSNVSFIGTGTPSTQVATTIGSGTQVGFIGTGSPASQVTTPAGTGSNVSFIGTGTPAAQVTTSTGTGSVVHNLGTGSPAAQVATVTGSGTQVSFVGAATLNSDVTTTAGTGSNVSFIGTGAPAGQATTVVGTGAQAGFLGSGTPSASVTTTAGTGSQVGFIGAGTPAADTATTTATGTNTAPNFTAAPALSAATTTASGTGTQAANVGTGTPSTSATTTAGTGSQVGFIGTGAPAAQAASPTATGTHTAPSFTAAVTLTSGTTTVAGTGTRTLPGTDGAGSITTATATATGAGTQVGFVASPTLASEVASASATGGSTAPGFSAAPTLTTAVSTLTGAGTQVGHVGSAATSTQTTTATGSGTSAGGSYAGSGTPFTGVTVAAGTGTQGVVGVATLVADVVTGAGVGVFAGPPVTGSGAVTLSAATMTGTASFDRFDTAVTLTTGAVVVVGTGLVLRPESPGHFALRSGERTYWLNRASGLPTGCPYVLSGVACTAGGTFAFRRRGHAMRTVHLSAGAVFRAKIDAIVWAETTATLLGVVHVNWARAGTVTPRDGCD